MSLPQPPPAGRTRPVSRVTRFAASVRARAGRVPAAPRTAWRPGRDHARRHGRPSAVDRVLRRPVAGTVAHHHRHRAEGARWDLRLTLLTVRQDGVLPSRRRPAAGDLRRPPAARPAAAPVPARPWRPALVHRSAVRRDVVPPPLVTVLRLPSDAPSLPTPHPPAGPPPAPPVPLVHRRPEPPAPRPGPGPAAPAPSHPFVPGAPATAPGPYAPSAPGAAAAAALTSRDMPVVVDHVVREIDRRMTAARERRGWPA